MSSEGCGAGDGTSSITDGFCAKCSIRHTLRRPPDRARSTYASFAIRNLRAEMLTGAGCSRPPILGSGASLSTRRAKVGMRRPRPARYSRRTYLMVFGYGRFTAPGRSTSVSQRLFPSTLIWSLNAYCLLWSLGLLPTSIRRVSVSPEISYVPACAVNGPQRNNSSSIVGFPGRRNQRPGTSR